MTKYLTPSLVSLFILVMLLVSILANAMMVPKLYDFRLSGLDAAIPPPRPIALPFNEPSLDNQRRYEVTGKLDYLPFQPGKFRIVADNCIESLKVNGTEVSVRQHVIGDPCDFAKGIIIDLKPHLKTGVNTMTIVIVDEPIPGGRRTFNMELVP